MEIVYVHVVASLLTLVPGMLEHESLQGISSMKPTGFRKRSNSILGDGLREGEGQDYSVSSVLQLLSDFHSCIAQQGMDQQLQSQAFRQLFYLIGATSLNSILLRKDLCSCRKGMQIRWVGLGICSAMWWSKLAGQTKEIQKERVGSLVR